MIRFGIIGLGKIAAKFAQDLTIHPGASLQAVASRDASKAQRFADSYGANLHYDSYEKLLEDNKVEIISQTDGRVEATVEGSGVKHTVVIDDRTRCTCTWFSRHQGERGPCKHILAVQKALET